MSDDAARGLLRAEGEGAGVEAALGARGLRVGQAGQGLGAARVVVALVGRHASGAGRIKKQTGGTLARVRPGAVDASCARATDVRGTFIHVL